MTTLAEKATRTLPPHLAQALDASLSELDRLADAAAAQTEGVGGVAAIRIDLEIPTLPGPGHELAAEAARRSPRHLVILKLSNATAVTRTEQRDHHFHLDLNVSLEGLDN